MLKMRKFQISITKIEDTDKNNNCYDIVNKKFNYSFFFLKILNWSFSFSQSQFDFGFKKIGAI